MAYVNRPTNDAVSERTVTNTPVVDYHDRIRWGPIISGIVIAIATQLILSALFAAIGATSIAGSGAPRTNAADVAGNVGIWSAIGLLISLLIGGWVTARGCGPMNRSTALLNGAILWATTLALSSWLVTSGVTGAFGLAASAASNAAGVISNQVQGVNPQNLPNISAEQARDIANATARSLWWFVFGSLLGLIASLIGAVVGARSPRKTYVESSVR
ncbi:MAG: hypothetical protein CLLPBCKN_004242 [Chroococcidiopsis cubana SAG 39.79]|jgi:hypothetical protein|uniref:PhnA-like protein n=1 Tax=Chroococcidiopsis cubana SAG 39.79 TaxID=388085 RepID=A0AB37UE56_9CYAN|nr:MULTISPECIES: hypothetical protein [Chroococcidiopsis]MBE9014962.1 hypothetical protein [Chroococcidiopsidales cyanobacterium LEGE 13417]MBD2304815.1 hypothetical protein [Chroococcidiopsis sp. [FACHB-1243]]MDZ4874846.1 hypothetical protein [Chroococcidiopsis cubana SAG 39.79]PSB62239.1 hypothetical protein C7B79_18850 [Chroococcidiopsis cubana CCALA 043]PSM47488.1 hypothetical protein C7Y66_19595 [Chroococcidiopsis sp. CCALA 051]